MIIIKICYFDFHCANNIFTCWESSGNIDKHIENIERERDRERERIDNIKSQQPTSIGKKKKEKKKASLYNTTQHNEQ